MSGFKQKKYKQQIAKKWNKKQELKIDNFYLHLEPNKFNQKNNSNGSFNKSEEIDQ